MAIPGNTPPLAEIFPELIEVAMGRCPADLVVRGATLANVNTRELQSRTDVAVCQGRIALVGRADHCCGPATTVIEADGRYLTPGDRKSVV